MCSVNIFVVLLLTTATITAAIPVASPMSEIEQVSQDPKVDVRGLFHDFYTQQMQGSNTMSSTSETDEDFGEKITGFVANTAVAMAEAGQQTVQQIIGTMGVELGEALKY